MPPFALADSWFRAGSYGTDDLLFGLLGSIDQLCAQFTTALQNAEHDHLFLLAALVGTATLVFPTQH
jgi:hypothetical protein